MSSRAMNKPTHMIAKAKTFAAADSMPGSAVPAVARSRPSRSSRRFRGNALVDAAVTDRPGRSRPSVAASPSSRMRTGTRCTILVKLPVAFSGRQTLNTAPVAGARLATWPWNTRPGSTSATIVSRHGRAACGRSGFP